jgi:phage/plasmid-like protein (TIGR03299 family)
MGAKNWNVRTVDAATLAPAGWEFAVPTFHIIRDDPHRDGQTVLGTRGERYVPLQNETAFGMGDYLLDGGGTWDGGAVLFGGRRVFGVLAVTDRNVTVGGKSGGENASLFVIVATSHDGTLPMCAWPGIFRPECANMLNMSMGQAVGRIHKIRHTASAEGRMADARATLQIAFDYADAWQNVMTQLAKVKITRDKFDTLIETAYPRPTVDAKGSFAKWENRRDGLMSLFTGKGDTDTTGNTRGTAYGALNALTERIDWHRTVRDGNTETMLADAFTVGSPGDREKTRLFEIVREFANV